MTNQLYKLLLLSALMVPVAASAQKHKTVLSVKATDGKTYYIPSAPAADVPVDSALIDSAAVAAGQVPRVLGYDIRFPRKFNQTTSRWESKGQTVVLPVAAQTAAPQTAASQTAAPQTQAIPENETLLQRNRRMRHIERVNRDEMKATFVPKGTWMFGGTIGFQEWDDSDNNMLVLKNMNHEGHVFGVSPYVGYFLTNNLCIGGRYSYSRKYFYLDSFKLNLGDDFNINLADIYYLGASHTASFFMRNYVPLGKSKIFAFFSEIDATYSHIHSKNSTGRGENFEGYYTTTNSVQLGFTPGLCAFVTDFMAVECSIGVMGLNYKWSEQRKWSDDNFGELETKYSHSGGANFRFNLLSVNIGTTFFF